MEESCGTGVFQTFPGMRRRTADPSASLGMTKVRVALPFGLMVLITISLIVLSQRQIPKENAALSFVIPSKAEGSAVSLNQQSMQRKQAD
jgi:hypothetical protein